MRAKKKFSKYQDLWGKIRNLIRLITTNSDDYDERYMKIKFDLDDELPPSMIIVGRPFFSIVENNEW